MRGKAPSLEWESKGGLGGKRIGEGYQLTVLSPLAKFWDIPGIRARS